MGMLVLLNNPQVEAQFMAVWQPLEPDVKAVLDNRISIISDGEAFPGCGAARNGSGWGTVWAQYDDWAELYSMVIRVDALADEGMGLRRKIARELAKVFHDGCRYTCEIQSALERGGEVDPWIPEVLSECACFEDFWTWLEEMFDFEAWATAREWGLPGWKQGEIWREPAATILGSLAGAAVDLTGWPGLPALAGDLLPAAA
jgi:hypothetical protein